MTPCTSETSGWPGSTPSCCRIGPSVGPKLSKASGVDTVTDPFFGLAVPRRVEGVPDAVLKQRESWKSPADYDAKASQLAEMFADNFEKYEDEVSDAVKAAGPRKVQAR
ncbi:MAG TPA: hypothetical protein VOA87_07335 [Thermoanaerobaculia bacterium]|nr:hypothetical protein [Thermoanaerobaculia bacterium]